MIYFVNLKIKPTQSFRCAHNDKMYIYIFIDVSIHTCMSMYVIDVSNKIFMTLGDSPAQCKLHMHPVPTTS
jgi:hypothetical protein